jgi:hypothetical protein
MANLDLLGNVEAATIAHKNAMMQAQFNTNALLRSFGFTMPGADGSYDVKTAQGAFNPEALFDKSTGSLNEGALQEIIKNLSVGTTGAIADVRRGGASQEAEAVAESRARGLGAGSGLASQRRRLAESMTGEAETGAKSQFVSALGQAYAPIGTAYQDLQTAQIQAQAGAEAAGAVTDSGPNYDTPLATTPVPQQQPNRADYTVRGRPGGKPPAKPGVNDIYRGPGGVQWMWRPKGPSGPGWYKQG